MTGGSIAWQKCQVRTDRKMATFCQQDCQNLGRLAKVSLSVCIPGGSCLPVALRRILALVLGEQTWPYKQNLLCQGTSEPGRQIRGECKIAVVRTFWLRAIFAFVSGLQQPPGMLCTSEEYSIRALRTGVVKPLSAVAIRTAKDKPMLSANAVYIRSAIGLSAMARWCGTHRSLSNDVLCAGCLAAIDTDPGRSEYKTLGKTSTCVESKRVWAIPLQTLK